MYFVLVTVVVILLLLWYWSKTAQRTLQGIDGPKAYPIIGSAHLLLGSEERSFSVVCALYSKYDKIFQIRLGPKNFLGLSDPDLIQEVLHSPSCQNKAFFYRFLEVDYGLISSRYVDWKVYRKMLNPAFNQRILISFISIFSRAAERMVKRMAEEEKQGRVFDLLHYTTQSTMEMVCASSLKSDIMDDPKTMGICSDFEKITSIMGSRVLNVLLHSDLLFALTPRYWELQKLTQRLRDTFSPIFLKRRAELQQQRAELEDETDDYRKPMVFLDQLLNMQRNSAELSIEEIECHLYTILGAGTETTASQVAYILLLLAMHPEVQERVWEEIRFVYDTDAQEITYETLTRQLYLEQVIKESLRLFPVAPVIGRETTEPMSLGGYTIPAGVTLLINIFLMHRRKDLWGEGADSFDPDRFDPLIYKSQKQHPCSFFPFGGGPRNCIGYRYSMFAMKTMVTQVLRRYKLSTPLTLDSTQRLSFAVTLKLSVGHMIKIEPRHT
ncbi:cytochrome P450 4c21-like [Anopheles darlingi]|uniref:cytochrome P450 4c21-like n=1 Tax=Anopheles darlingi TaxID=43151 RepID=UPI00210065A3|nr:cytochrome P450 4c21-like [Anopheles darlingi]